MPNWWESGTPVLDTPKPATGEWWKSGTPVAPPPPGPRDVLNIPSSAQARQATADQALHAQVQHDNARTPEQSAQGNAQFDAQVGRPWPDRSQQQIIGDLPASYIPRTMTAGGAQMIGAGASLLGANGVARDANAVARAAATVDPGIGTAVATGLIGMAPLLLTGGAVGAGAKMLGAGARAAQLASTVAGAGAFGKSAATQTGIALEDENAKRREQGLPEYTQAQMLAAQGASFAINAFVPAAFTAGERFTGMALGQAFPQGAVNAAKAGASMSVITGLNKAAD